MSLGVYDLDTGEQTTVPLENGWGNVAMTAAGDHLFYIGGRTDVSATPLYEVNLETWEIEQLEPTPSVWHTPKTALSTTCLRMRMTPSAELRH